jgi:hypothetical protein
VSETVARRSFARMAELASDLIDRMHLGEITPEQALAEWRKVRLWEERNISYASAGTTSGRLRKPGRADQTGDEQ